MKLMLALSLLLRGSSDAFCRTEVLTFSVETATKLFKMKPVVTSVAHELRPFDPANRVIYCARNVCRSMEICNWDRFCF